jgi:hypothetical protein
VAVGLAAPAPCSALVVGRLLTAPLAPLALQAASAAVQPTATAHASQRVRG